MLWIAVCARPAFCITKTFTAAGGNDLWSNGSNWSPAGVPTNSDDVIIANNAQADTSAVANTVTIQSPAKLQLNPGFGLTVSNASTIDSGGTLFLAAGNFDGNGDLTVNGTVEIGGGTILGSGALNINSGGLMLFDGTWTSSRVLRSITNAGTINFLNTITTGNHFGLGGATITNTGVIDIQTDHDLAADAGTPILNNNSGGILKKSAGSGTAGVNFAVNNAGGTIAVQSGTLALNDGGSSSGAWTLAAGTTLSVAAGTVTTSGAASLTGPGAVSIASGANLTVASLAVNGTPTINGSGTFSIAGTVDVASGTDLTCTNGSNVVLTSGGNVTGAGSFSASGNFTWSGGGFSGSGTKTINSAAPAIDCAAGNCTVDGALVYVNGPATYSASANALVLSNAASLIVYIGATLDITNDGDVLQGSGALSTLGVDGTLWKKTTAGTSTVTVDLFQISGTIEVDAGTLQFGGGAYVNQGTYTIGAGAAVEITGGTFGWHFNPITVSGAGTFIVSGGTLQLDIGVNVDMPHLLLQGTGTILGGGTLVLSGTSSWTGGSMTFGSPGNTRISASGTLDVSSTVTLSNRTLQNDGVLNVNGTIGGSFGTIANNGTLVVNGSSAIAAALNNSGTVNPKAALSLSGGGTDSGTYTIANGVTVSLTGGLFTLSGTPSFGSAGTLSVAGATVTLGNGVNVTWPNLTLSSGFVNGAGTLHVTGNFTWSGGTISGSGLRNLYGVSTISCASAPCFLDGSVLYLHVSGTFSASANPLNFANGATLVVDTGTTLSITNDGDFTNGGGASNAISLNGTIWKKTTTGTSTFAVFISQVSGATLRTDAGTLQLGGGALVQAGATIDVAAGSTLQITGGTFALNGAPGSMPVSGNFVVSGGTLQLNGSITIPIANFALQGTGTVAGSGTLVLPGTSSWSGGTMSGSGITRIDSGNALIVSGNPALTQGRQLLNNGTITFTGIGMTISSATLTNNGTLNLNGNSNIGNAGTGTIDNSGTLAKIGGSGSSTIVAAVNNSGTVNAAIGTLRLSGGGTHSGSFSIAPGATLSFSGGTHTMTGAGSISGSGSLLFDGATATVGIPISVGALNVVQGVATLNAAADAAAFSLGGGTLGGSGTLTLTNGGSWLGGTMTGSGKTINPSSKTLTIITASVTLGRTLQNDGTLTLGANVFGSGTIANNGTLNTTGASIINAAVNNNGQITTTAALSLSGGGTHTGSFTTTSPGVLAFSGGTHTMTGGGSIGGTGTLSFTGAAATVGIPISVGSLNVTSSSATLNASSDAAAFQINAGTIGGSGTLTLTNGGTWFGGAMIGSGKTVVPPSKLLATNGPVSLGRTLQNDGTLFVNGTISGAGTIVNNGVLQPNEGAITIGAALNNSGQVALVGSALTLAGGGTHTGSFTIDAFSNLLFKSGTHSVGGGGSISGPGSLSFNGAAATIGVPVNVGALSVTAGTATLNAAAGAGAFSMSGGTLDGSGTLTLSNGGSWSGGTMGGSGATINPGAKSLGISGPVTLSGRTLQNDGTLNVSAAVAGSAGAIVNNGALNALGDSTISAPLNNSGQIATNGAVLSLAGSGTHSGSFTVNAPGVVAFSGGVQTISGPLSGTGTIRFSGAAATVGGAWSAMPVDVTAGSVAFNTSGTIPALTMSGGTLAGSGNLTISGPSTWSGGTIAGGGSLTVDSGATVAMPGTVAATLNRPLLNKGTITFAAATNGLLIDGAAVTNAGIIDIRSSQPIGATAGTPAFVNQGLLKKSAGAGVTQFAAPLSNSGQVQIGAGTMNFSGTYTQSAGTTTVLPGATLQTATLSLNGGSLTGNGTIAATVDNHAVVAPGASPGTLTISGDYVQASGGSLDIEIGGTAPGTQYDRVLVSGAVTLDGTLNVIPINGFVPSAGESFQILTFGSRTGAFAARNGLNYGSGTTLLATFSATDLQLATQSQVADLAASISAPATVANGSAFAYTVSIYNGGSSSAAGVGFTASLPPNVTFNSASPAVCSGAPNLVCTIGSIAFQSTAAVVLNVKANAAGAAPLAVSATGSYFDPNLANNQVATSPNITPAADLQIAVSGSGSTTAGSQVIYTIAVANNGPDAASNVTVTAAASPGLTFAANAGACNGAFPCNVGTLTPGQSAAINTAWNIAPSAAGTVQLTVNAASPLADPNAQNNTATAATQIGACPGIAITAPSEMTEGTEAAASVTVVAGATYTWSIANGSISDGAGTNGIKFVAGSPGTTTLTVNVTGGGCTLQATFTVTIKARSCQGSATPTAPPDGTTTSGAVVTFAWDGVDGASGYRLWLQQGTAPLQDLGTTLGTSLEKTIPPGSYRWFVETLFDGCASHESPRLSLTLRQAADCATRGRPELSAPAADATTSNATVTFSWSAADKAISYELWLAPAGGAPTLVRTTSDTSQTASVAPGRLEWFVRALFAGCSATESVHRTFIYAPPADCATNQRPLLIAPAGGERRLTSPVTFSWSSVAGATSYELYVDGVLAATVAASARGGTMTAHDVALQEGERRWLVRTRFATGCAPLDSAESRFAVVPAPRPCDPLDAPVIAAPGQISAGVQGRLQWSFVPGATAYIVEIATESQFASASTISTTVEARQIPISFVNDSGAPSVRYVRAHAIDGKCVPPSIGPYSPVAVLYVLPPGASEGAALAGDATDVPYVLTIDAKFAGQSFTATPTVPWITVAPADGVVPPGGQQLRATAHSDGLPPGTNFGGVTIRFGAANGAAAGLAGDSVTSSITLVKNPLVTPTPKDTPPPDALIIPAVASVQNPVTGGRIQSDIRIANTSAQPMNYDLTFIQSGSTGIRYGLQTPLSIEPGATIAINNITVQCFGVATDLIGTLEIRPLTEVVTSTSNAPVDALADRVTFASSRTYNAKPGGGTFGQYIPAIPYANFIANGGVVSLQQLGKSAKYRTSLGLVEGSGDAAELDVRIFNAAGAPLAEFPVKLNGGEHQQIDDVLAQHGVKLLDDGRIEVQVTNGGGKVTAYASVLDSGNGDSLLVPPVRIDGSLNTKWVVPGVADLTGGAAGWQSDVRIFNAGADPVELTLAFHSMNGGDAATQTIALAAGEVRQLDRVLSSVFGITQDAGALHVSSSAPAQLVVTARTYALTASGAYGQFIAAVTPKEAVRVGSRPLQLLQVEESPYYRSNVGFAEVSGQPVTLEVTVFAPGIDPAVFEVTLAPNEFRQFNSLLTALGLGETYNARISVRATQGEGRAAAYLSLIDAQSGDPTYIPAQ